MFAHPGPVRNRSRLQQQARKHITMKKSRPRGRPPKNAADKSVRLTITLAPEVIGKLDRLGDSRSRVIAALIMQAKH